MGRRTPAGTLIVGASHAGVQIAASLRELGDQAPITLVGSEPHPPYQRPPLSKGFLAGSMEDNSTLILRSPSFFEESAIDLIVGDGVTDLALSVSGGSGSGAARTASGRTLTFDRLALAVGGQPRRLEVPGHDLEGIRYLRTLDDATRIRAGFRSAASVVVVGGGFIGLEAASVARSAGCEVTVVEATDRLLGRAVAPIVSEFYRTAHERRGTSVELGALVTGFLGRHSHVSAVQLDDGRELPADLVLIGIGMVPHTELARSIGLECDGGIVVDEFARTSRRAVVAAGDCTVGVHPTQPQVRMRLESVQNAVGQARRAASALLGRLDGTPSVPWFWSDQDDLKLQIAGLNHGYDRFVVRGDPSSERFSVLYFRDDELLALDAVNAPRDYLAVRKALSQGRTILPERVGDTGVELAELIDWTRESSTA
jgi:3-phenylpropionate/trans-cinnamate dioxygenase ferredoxin reductase subunit